MPWERIIALLGIIGACVTFSWGVYTWSDEQRLKRDLARIDYQKTLEQRAFETQKVFLEKQLQIYTAAVQTTSTLANVDAGKDEWHDAAKKFWYLYWGDMSMVENPEVETAMVKFGNRLALDWDPYYQKQRNGLQITEVSVSLGDKEKIKGDLQPLSLNLAHAVRQSLDSSWGINAWRLAK